MLTTFGYRLRRVLALGLLALLGCALAAAAGARDSGFALTSSKAPRVLDERDLERSKRLWATINVCDTPANGDKIGIRGNMPATGRRLSMFMRFQVHYLAASDGKWHTVKQGDSSYIAVGTAARGTRDTGWLFEFEPPADGGAHQLRGAVTFVWRDSKGRAVHKIRELTEAGHGDVAGADPKGFSAATCAIS